MKKIYFVCTDIDRNGTPGAWFVEVSTSYNVLHTIERLKAATDQLLTVTICTTKKQAQEMTAHFQKLIKERAKQ